jgi:hypothetical protein
LLRIVTYLFVEQDKRRAGAMHIIYITMAIYD